MAETYDTLKKAENFASSEGGTTAPAAAQRHESHASDKMENELEMQKEHKSGADNADQVAGREGKGTMTGLLEKITGDPKKGDSK